MSVSLGIQHEKRMHHIILGAWGGVVVKVLRYQSDGLGIDFRWCHWIFQWHISFRQHHGPGIDSAPSENEYQEHFLGVKAADEWGWRPNYLHVQNVMKSVGLNLLEPSGPHRASYGTALPLPYYIITCTDGRISEEKTLNIKCVFWFSLQIYTLTFLILRRIRRYYHALT